MHSLNEYRVLCELQKVAVFTAMQEQGLLKTGGAGRFITTRKINIVIKAPFEHFD